MLISLHDLVKRYQIKPTGFFHVGANTGQELDDYLRYSQDIIFIEADPKVCKKLIQHVRHHNNVLAYCLLLAEVDGLDVTFHISNNEGQSSSVLDFGYHSTAHPTVVYIDHIPLVTTRADTFCAQNNLDIKDYDFLNIDVQGMELSVLKGMGEDLHKINYAYLEVNSKEVYKGCALVGEIDEYLFRYGLKPREESWAGNTGWGDKFYMR